MSTSHETYFTDEENNYDVLAKLESQKLQA